MFYLAWFSVADFDPDLYTVLYFLGQKKTGSRLLDPLLTAQIEWKDFNKFHTQNLWIIHTTIVSTPFCPITRKSTFVGKKAKIGAIFGMD